MRILISSTTSFWNISHSENNWARYNQKHILVFTQSTCYSCPVLIKFISTDFQKYSNTKFHKIHQVWAKFIHVKRWTDMMKIILYFHNFVKATKNIQCRLYVRNSMLFTKLRQSLCTICLDLKHRYTCSSLIRIPISSSFWAQKMINRDTSFNKLKR